MLLAPPKQRCRSSFLDKMWLPRTKSHPEQKRLFYVIVLLIPKTAFPFELSSEQKCFEPIFGSAQTYLVYIYSRGVVKTLPGLMLAGIFRVCFRDARRASSGSIFSPFCFQHTCGLSTTRCSAADASLLRTECSASIVGAAFLFWAGGWTLSTETCRRCEVFVGRLLRAVIVYRGNRGRLWHEWGAGGHPRRPLRCPAVGFPSFARA